MLLYYFFTAADYDKAEDIADMLLVRQTSSTIIDDVPSKPITDNSCTIIYIHILLETSDCSFKFHITHHKNDKVLILLLVNLGLLTTSALRSCLVMQEVTVCPAYY